MNTLFGWALVFHILGIVFWMGGLLISTHLLRALTRMSSEEARQALSRLLSKVFNGIVHPGAIITIVAGMLLFSVNPQYYASVTWMRVKLLLVLILIVLDVMTYLMFRATQSGRKRPRHRTLILLHMVTAVVFLGVLIMVIIRPFGP